MSEIDWIVLSVTIGFIVTIGVYKNRKSQSLSSYLLSDKKLNWRAVAISIIATQASAITFLSMPGQAYSDGLGFIQIYFGLPLAMLVLAYIIMPLYKRLNIYTAYEFLEMRFDLKTRVLGSILFLIQRSLAVGFTIYAPSLIFSNILGWNSLLTSLLIGVLIIIYTVSGGAKAVMTTHRHQMLIILLGMFVVGGFALFKLPVGVRFQDTFLVADTFGKLNPVSLNFDITERYNIWSGLIGGFFLALAYFGTDQSQVQRYLSGKTTQAAKRGLLFNGIIKIPLQLAILFLGILVFTFYQFEKPPIFFNQKQYQKVAESEYGLDLTYLESVHNELFIQKKEKLKHLLDNSSNNLTTELITIELQSIEKRIDEVESEAARLIALNSPGTTTNDKDQIFLTFITNHLPIGMVGFLLAVIISASMSSASSILNALAGTSIVDIYQRLYKSDKKDDHYVSAGRKFTLLWGLAAIGFAIFANFTENLIQAINIVGSLFYGSVLGIFLVGFFFQKIRGNAVFIAAICSQVLVFILYLGTDISFLWFNLIGTLFVPLIGIILQITFYKDDKPFHPRGYASRG
jgi:Na+/proline symporter